MIGIIDYGLGNVKAFANIYHRLGIPHKFVKTSSDFKNTSHLILPGVGSFDFAMNKLNNSGLKDQLNFLVLNEKIPVIGICVGMQIMAKGSDEGSKEGLGWFDTHVVKFNSSHSNFPLPHMGWNSIAPNKDHILFKNLDSEKRFYFLHSYHFDSNQDFTLATSTYANDFSVVINSKNIFGIQCHPEKSHHNGIAILRNFAGYSYNA